MVEKRATNSELRLQRLTREDPAPAERGILELFDEAEQEQPDEDAPLAREADENDA